VAHSTKIIIREQGLLEQHGEEWFKTMLFIATADYYSRAALLDAWDTTTDWNLARL
jgi:hypothetical protein